MIGVLPSVQSTKKRDYLNGKRLLKKHRSGNFYNYRSVLKTKTIRFITILSKYNIPTVIVIWEHNIQPNRMTRRSIFNTTIPKWKICSVSPKSKQINRFKRISYSFNIPTYKQDAFPSFLPHVSEIEREKKREKIQYHKQL